ncbi:MAG TPA: TolC family protein [Gemmatales bacterium]|nr:TolC family protein [Gemmatales bacterium]
MRMRYIGGGLVLLLILLVAGCSREYYFRDADKETYGALQERNRAPWFVPDLKIEPPPESRIFVPGNEVKPPQPPDDPPAHEYMLYADGIRGSIIWKKWGTTDGWDNPDWMAYLPWDKNGKLPLNPDDSVILGQTNSVFYRTAVEDLYLSALALTLNRFEFVCQWYLLNSTIFQHTGTNGFPTETNSLTTNTNFGFNRYLSTGGQLIIDFANSFVFEYTGHTQTVTSNITGTFIQPLLRNGGKYVRMETLTQGERNTLYAIRDFARFRKQYWFNLTMRDTGFLGLQLAAQNVRNAEENVRRLQQIYQLHLFLITKGGSISQVQLDQIFLSLKQGQAGLIQAKTTYENLLDNYKFTLGLPPALPVKLEKELLDQFALTTPEMDAIQVELSALELKLRQPDQAPPLAELKSGAENLQQLLKRTEAEARIIEKELAERIKALPAQTQDPDEQQAKVDLKGLTDRISDLFGEMTKLQTSVASNLAEMAEKERTRDWERLQRRTRELLAIQGDLLVYQNQVRVYAVQLKPFNMTEDDCVRQALENRLDLMNVQAQVVDSWRKLNIAANGLEGGLYVVSGMNIGTAPLTHNPFDFSAQASSYRVGLQFDAPLTRQAERNTFRSSIIQYHRARRTYLNRCDSVVQSLRRNLRQLETDRLNFEIARQSLIAAARQLEATRIRLLIGGDLNPATGTLDTLTALSSLLTAKNTLIASWANYENDRMQLLLDMEAIQLDERGLYHDDFFAIVPKTN